MKNIKLFKTDNERTTFENSAAYIEPYVSNVESDDSVHYNKQKEMISFGIYEGDPSFTHLFNAEQGMTWRVWVDTSYNNGGYEIGEDRTGNPVVMNDRYIVLASRSQSPVDPDTTIVNGINYQTMDV